jgi:GAF domain-containing protein
LVLLDEGDEISYGCRLYEGEFSPIQNLDVFRDGLASWVIRNKQPALVEDTSEDPRWMNRTWENESPKKRSVISLPLLLGRRLVGVLTLARTDGRKFSLQDLRKLQEFTLG